MWIMDFLFTSLQTLTRPLDEHLLWAPLEIFLSHSEAAGMRGQKKQQQHSSAELSLERREKEMKSKEEEEKKERMVKDPSFSISGQRLIKAVCLDQRQGVLGPAGSARAVCSKNSGSARIPPLSVLTLRSACPARGWRGASWR